MALNQLPYEILLQIISNLNYKETRSLLQCNRSLAEKSNQDSFWKDLCVMKGIGYRCPDITWSDLYKSGSVHTMCPHLSSKGFPDKKKNFWSQLNKIDMTNSLMYCLYPSCQFLGTDDEFAKHRHPVALTLSPLHIFDVWCDNCCKLINLKNDYGASYGARSEGYVLESLLKNLGSLCENDSELNREIIKGRRTIERKIYSLQARFVPVNLIERDWYLSWLDFITGKSYELPGLLNNESLQNPKDKTTLNPNVSLGQDFEIIPEPLKQYIEKFYSFTGPFTSIEDLQGNPAYCKLVHKIKLRHQIQRAAFTPPIVFAEV